MSHIRVLLVDTNDYLLEVVSEWLVSDSGISVAGMARSGREAITLAESLSPDLILMDATLPDMSGFDATRLIKTRPDAAAVVLMTLHDSRAAQLEAVAAGADRLIAGARITGRLTTFVRELRKLKDASVESRVCLSTARTKPDSRRVRPVPCKSKEKADE